MTELPERDLPPGRHLLLKEHLMTEILRAQDSPRTRRAWLRPALVAGAVAAVCVLAFTLVAPSVGDDRAAASRPVTARALLESMAVAAEHRDDGFGKARDDQFMYVDKELFAAQPAKSTGRARPPYRLEAWLGVDSHYRQLVKVNGQAVRSVSITYAEPSVLPADAEGMYTWLREQGAKVGHLRGTELVTGSMFTAASDLLDDGLLSAKQTAALYRAVARIPGVTVAGNAVDAAGRPGAVLAHQEQGGYGREEWIFDRKTYGLLGTRFVYTEDHGAHKKGSVDDSTAILGRAIVDKAGQRP
ncbi:CU044_5270 family protein [Streptomyces adustus]|uniref:CU044_5270 family protein n=1 Tax=Streptomyces adustus TaxID=1609272 RepID=UPI00371DBFD6